jgi:hypothetical protein
VRNSNRHSTIGMIRLGRLLAKFAMGLLHG